MDIGQNICKQRKIKGLSQKQLADMLGVTLQAVSKWENGISDPSAKSIVQLYKIFGGKLFFEASETDRTELHRSNMSGIAEIYKIGGITSDGKKFQQNEIVYPHHSFAEISEHCKKNNISLWQYAYSFEKDLPEYLEKVWAQMVSSVKAGLKDEGLLPGGLNVHKKARQLYESEHVDETPETKSNRLICAYAFAVSEQNASTHTIVTAPTCCSAGVVPAVLFYEQQRHNYSNDEICKALATAGIIGNIIKTNASISGAECGCQAEIGSACAMAAAALGSLFELSIDKIEYASEIALEHHLGLTCDPVCGLAQIPCIERNAVAAMRAINAVNLSSLLWQTRKISLDKIIETLKDTGNDLPETYRETGMGSLAKHYTENNL